MKTKVIHFEKARQKIRDNKPHRYNAYSAYGGWVNAYEPVNKGRLASTQEWKIEKLGRKYY